MPSTILVAVIGVTQKVERLLAEGLDVNSQDDGQTALHQAMNYNRVSIVRLLLARPETRLDITDEYGWTPLHPACWYNSAAVIRLYCQDVRCTPALLNKKDDLDQTPLMSAVFAGSLTSVRELARVEGVDWETRNSGGQSLLEVAREMRHQDIVTFLEERVAVRQAVRAREETEVEEERPAQRPRLEGGEAGAEEDEIKEQKNKLQKMARSDRAIPECPVCLERMTGEIYSCKNGHGICGTCKPRVRICATCRSGKYICRNIVLEQTVRVMVQEE